MPMATRSPITPTIGALAKGGLLFRNVYSNAPVCAPTRFAILTGVYPESCAPAQHMRAEARFPKNFRTYPELLRAAGYFCTNDSKTDYNCDVDPKAIWDVHGGSGHWRGRPAGAPFMAVFNDETSHESRIFRPTPGRVTPDQITLPPYLPDTPGIRQDYASYYNLIERMDGHLATRLAELEADWLKDDTIVFYYSDNGGVLPRSKRYCYDEGHRCAMVVYVPPKWRHLMPQAPGTEVTAPVSYIDLVPTLLSLAGVPQPAQMPGQPFLGRRIGKPQRWAFGIRNRMDERVDFIRTVTDGRWRYIRNYMPHRPWAQHQAFEWLAKGYQDWETAHRAGTLDPVQDRFFGTKPFEELYDLSADPHQVRNLAGDATVMPRLDTMRRALDAHMRAINDNGFLPERIPGEGYAENRDGTVYPLDRVMALAAMAAKREAANVGALHRALTDPVPVLRYWAATGLPILGAAAAPARTALVQAMQHDPSPEVRIVAAEAAAGLGDAAVAVPLLTAIVDQPPSWQLQSQALNALTFIGDAARPALPAIERAALSDQEYVRNAGRYLSMVLDGTYTPSAPVLDIGRLMQGQRAGTKERCGAVGGRRPMEAGPGEVTRNR